MFRGFGGELLSGEWAIEENEEILPTGNDTWKAKTWREHKCAKILR